MFTLQDLLDAFAEGGIEAVTALLADVQDDAAVSALRGEAADAFQTLLVAESRSVEDVATMSVLADLIDGLRADETRRTDALAAAQADIDALAARVAGELSDTTPEAPAPDPEPEPEAPAPEPEPEPSPELAVRRPRVSLADINRRAPAMTAPPAADGPRTRIVAAADVPGFAAGHELTMSELAEAGLVRWSGLPDPQKSGFTGRIAHQFGIIQKPARPGFTLDGIHDDDIIERASDETLLDGGSLVAAGGWCAPSETWYDLCPGLETGAGMLSLPEVVAARGGVRWTKGPQFCDFYSGTGFFTQTEAQAIAGTTKPCFEIPCPDFDEVRLDAYGLCLTAGILQNRGYPEYVRRFISGSLTAHAHRVNAAVIASVESQSIAVTPTVDSSEFGAANSVLNSLELYVENYRYRFRMDPNRSLQGVAPLWLRGVIRADIAQRNGSTGSVNVTDADISSWFASRGVMMEFVYDWQDALCGVGARVVNDAVTTSGDATLTSADANFVAGDVGAAVYGPGIPAGTTILSRTSESSIELSHNATASATGVELTIIEAGATAYGADPAGVTQAPASVRIMLFAAGTFVKLTSDIITLEAVYDSTLFTINKYTALFTEEGVAVIQRCYESVVASIPICANGVTGAQVEVTCPA